MLALAAAYPSLVCDASRKLLVLRAIGPLTITILSIAIVNIWKLQNAPSNIRVVGKIPKV